ncbi:MAG: mechanosensitive ion channel domain-containing protein [Gemmatimonadaceae bacterium]
MAPMAFLCAVAFALSGAFSPAGGQTTAVPADTAALIVQNRTIIVFRGPLGARDPQERAAAASERIRAAARADGPGDVTIRRVPEGVVIYSRLRPLFAVTHADADGLAGETLDQVAVQSARRVQDAIRLERDQRSLAYNARAVLQAAFAIALFALFMRALVLGRRRLGARAERRAWARIQELRVGGYTLLDRRQILTTGRRTFDLAIWAIGLFAAYLALTFILTRFPFSRPWGEALGSYLVNTVAELTLGVVTAIPGLFTVLLIFFGTRFLARLVKALFGAIEAGQVSVPWAHPDTAKPTRRLIVALLWVFALVVAYPYLPGSDSNVFKGVSVFAGLVLSLGSSGIVNQAMSGLVLMYSRAMRAGDYVHIGGVEGTVTEVGMLSTKVRTNKLEEVTIPNALLVSQTTKNYTRLAAEQGVILYTTVTIGYDTPWRQVHALLELAASRTTGVRSEPRPFVRQLALSDHYPEYQLNVYLDRPETRIDVLSKLHMNIQDAFNEFGVQIMSPHYEEDPDTPKIVRPEQWFAPPATRSDEG